MSRCQEAARLGCDRRSDAEASVLVSPTPEGLSSLTLGEGGPGRRRRDTCAGVPVLGQLVALPAVAVVGAVGVGALLAAAPGLTLVDVCAQTGRGSRGRPPGPEAGPRSRSRGAFSGRPSVPASPWG